MWTVTAQGDVFYVSKDLTPLLMGRYAHIRQDSISAVVKSRGFKTNRLKRNVFLKRHSGLEDVFKTEKYPFSMLSDYFLWLVNVNSNLILHS